jgi:hypothetical protein
LSTSTVADSGWVPALNIHTHGEIRFAEPRSNFGGQLLPANTGAALPLTGSGRFSHRSSGPADRRTDQPAGESIAVSTGFADPFFGKQGTQRFANIVFIGTTERGRSATIIGRGDGAPQHADPL